ncbi:Hypothetical protein R9X50_00792000 [Acrodontium crateriforme]|uniref:BHLH domain-containing protein n=1 Tax=Acrodontium crateriforme TaxID=150365 RepID=A0AAQ3MAF9_9PEZI|nr:Hypothetical protein R9X50_00792000 [Acrodontium crateriforme]
MPTMNGQEKPRLTDSQKKQNHIESEKKRREAIRKGFDRLAEIVPGMEGSGRSEAVVLQATVEYLRGQMRRKEELRKAARQRGMSDADFDKAYQGISDAADDADASPASDNARVKKE